MYPESEVALEIIIPARNEADRLPHGLTTLSAKLAGLTMPRPHGCAPPPPVSAAVLVVDNASTDATADVVRSWTGPVPVRLMHCAEPGKGAAVRAGLLATTAPYVGFCDADMATGLDALDTVLALLADGGQQVVVGSRRHPGSVVEARRHPLRRLGAIAFNRLCRDIAGGIADTQCGFKFLTGPLGRAIAADLRTTGFAFDVELLMRCAQRGVSVRAVPVHWRDMPGSTFSVRRHTAECLRDLVRLRAAAHTQAQVLELQQVSNPAPQITGPTPSSLDELRA